MRQWMPRLTLIAVACGVLSSGMALAQDQPMTASDPEMAKIQEELKAIRAELAAVRAELKQVSLQLRAMQTAQKPVTPPKPAPPDNTVHNIPIDDSPVRGPKDAPVTVVEYISFACGYCIREDPMLKDVLKAYPNDVRWVVKHFPMWDRAKPAHAAAALAMKQLGNDGFWKMYDKIVAGGARKLEKSDLRQYAEDLGMDLAAFDAVMADDAQIAALADVDATAARGFGVGGTPAVFINGKRLQGRRPLEAYKAMIDEALKQAKGEKKGS
ncbi:MAG: DsbA family protein [Phycisphaerae bacterium]|nr:DsbA family protein [Phycisphaerae bacterium]